MSQKIYTNLDIKGNATIGDITNATSDTDKFLVSDAGVVKYRTGSEMLSDLGVAPGVASNVQHQVKAGVAINKGQAVYVTSADGTNMIVGLASNTAEVTSSKTMGLLDNTVAINGFANVVTEGLLAGLNTIGANAGDPVWLGTGGNLIYGLANKPSAPAHLVFIGIVTRVNANNGEIFIKAQNGFELNEIHDVDLKTTSPSGNEILAFEGAPVNLWKNKTISSVLGYTPYNASNPAGYTTNTGTVTSVSGTGGYGGLTLSGSVTTSGSLTLGGTPTGTWPIAISGNAATATNADYANAAGTASTATNANYLSILGGSGGNLNTMPYGRYYNYGSGSYWTNGPSGMSYGSVYNFGGSSESVLSLQLAADINHNSTSSTRTMWFRTGNNLGFQNDWKEVLHSGNYSSFAVPTSRTITINGTSYDLSSDRSWTVSGSDSTKWPLEGSWKPSSLASSTRLRGATSPDGGEFALAYSGGQIHPYTDGFFYQNEGAYRVIDTNSIGSYAPSLTGGGASGTWGISVTGTAAGATYLNSSNYINRTGTSGNLNTDFQNTPAGTFRYQGDDAAPSNSPGGTWWIYQNMRHSNGSNYWGTQVAWGWEDNANKLATRNITGNSFGPWVYYINSSNVSSYALPITGNHTRTGTVYNIGTFSIGQNTNGTAVIDAYNTYAYYGCNTASNGMAIGPSGLALFSNKIIVGSFPNSTTNTGEAWIGRAADRNAGTLTVQLGGNSSSGRSFEVVDYAWSVVLFSVTSGGTATASGDIVAYSDKRVKENINTIEGALDKVSKLRGVTYNRIDTEDKSEKVGVIAQEVQQVLPQVVHEQENGMLGVSYGNLAGLFIEAIKEQQTQIDELKQLIKQLTNK